MVVKKFALASALALALAGCAGGYGAATATSEVVATAPPPRAPEELQVLFWNEAQRSARFRDMEDWFAGLEVPAASRTRALPQGAPLSAAMQAKIRATMASTNTAGVMVLHDGKVRFEDYGLGLLPTDRWTSFSVAKSFTSTLLGAALKDGKIASLDDPVTRYIPELAGSAYDGVNVRQLATMTSGVAWNEDYSDPNSDVAQTNKFVEQYGEAAIVEQMKALEREAPPGEKWVYKTGETNLIGVLIENAVGMPLATYAREKIVEPAGFAGDLFWMTDPRGGNIGGCCLSLPLSDYARMGQLALEGGGDSVPAGWFTEAAGRQVRFGDSDFGYGYQWWTYPGNNYGAQGIFGQGITVVPDKDMVVAYVGNWSKASGGPERNAMRDLIMEIAAEIE